MKKISGDYDNSGEKNLKKPKRLLKKGLKIAIICVAAVVFVIGAGFGVFFINNAVVMGKMDKAGTAFESRYKMDEKGEYVANIPYEDYLFDARINIGQVVHAGLQGDSWVKYYYNGKNGIEEINFFDIKDYGARTFKDYATNREAINNAIKAASEAGGGLVNVGGGEYLCANIELMSNVILFIEKGSALKNIDYDLDKKENGKYHKQNNGFLFADGAVNVTITGGGKIIGQGETYTKAPKDASIYYPLNEFNTNLHNKEFKKRLRKGKDNEYGRYYMLNIENSKNITVENIEFTGASSWTCRMKDNDNVLFENVVINNNVHVANSDGIDILGGQNIEIKHCFIATGDDGVCIKTEDGSGAVKGVTVTDCEIMANANSFKIGTGTYSDVTDVTVSNCYFFMAGIGGGYGGIAIEAVDGGTVSNVTITDIFEDHVTTPFVLWCGNREGRSKLFNITLKNIAAVGVDVCSAVTGTKRQDVTDITLENITITYRNAGDNLRIFRGDKAYGGTNMNGYPESLRVSSFLGIYYDLPSYGLFLRYVDRIDVKNFNVTGRDCETRPIFYRESVKNYNEG